MDVLSGALDAWDTELTADALLEYTLECRSAFLTARLDKAYESLAVEIAYDRALIALCADHGIAAKASDFDDPRTERSHLEAALRAGAGVDLVSLSRARASGAAAGRRVGRS